MQQQEQPRPHYRGSDDRSNYIYLYELPKSKVTSVGIAKLIEEKCGIKLDVPPQIKRDILRPFYSAMIRVTNSENHKKIVEALRYFDYDSESHCRALPFDKDIFTKNVMSTHNIFVKGLDNIETHKQLEEAFKPFATRDTIKSCKLSINEFYKSNGYGFVCFNNSEDARDALEHFEKVVKDIPPERKAKVCHYIPKDKGDLRKVFNNVYVKNFPQSFGEEELKELFKAYGNITSLVVQSTDVGKTAFVCFSNPEEANKAVEVLHGKDLGEADKKLYVQPALSKQQRMVQL